MSNSITLNGITLTKEHLSLIRQMFFIFIPRLVKVKIVHSPTGSDFIDFTLEYYHMKKQSMVVQVCVMHALDLNRINNIVKKEKTIKQLKTVRFIAEIAAFVISSIANTKYDLNNTYIINDTAFNYLLIRDAINKSEATYTVISKILQSVYGLTCTSITQQLILNKKK